MTTDKKSSLVTFERVRNIADNFILDTFENPDKLAKYCYDFVLSEVNYNADCNPVATDDEIEQLCDNYFNF